jgi:hypothetical protein
MSCLCFRPFRLTSFSFFSTRSSLLYVLLMVCVYHQELTGKPWAKNFKPTYGTIKEFVAKHPKQFLIDEKDKVHLQAARPNSVGKAAPAAAAPAAAAPVAAAKSAAAPAPAPVQAKPQPAAKPVAAPAAPKQASKQQQKQSAASSNSTCLLALLLHAFSPHCSLVSLSLSPLGSIHPSQFSIRQSKFQTTFCAPTLAHSIPDLSLKFAHLPSPLPVRLFSIAQRLRRTTMWSCTRSSRWPSLPPPCLWRAR